MFSARRRVLLSEHVSPTIRIRYDDAIRPNRNRIFGTFIVLDMDIILDFSVFSSLLVVTAVPMQLTAMERLEMTHYVSSGSSYSSFPFLPASSSHSAGLSDRCPRSDHLASI